MNHSFACRLSLAAFLVWPTMQHAVAAPDCLAYTAMAVQASGDDGDGNVAALTQDGKLDTRWSGPGKGAWLQLDLGRLQKIAAAQVAWYDGNGRTYHFEVSTSKDGQDFVKGFGGDSVRNNSLQTYELTNTRSARYLRLTVNGNTSNDWASVTEAKICGPAIKTPAPDSGPSLPRKPYLQSVSASSAIVAFRTSSSCTPRVKYGVGQDTSLIANATRSDRYHAITLPGLKAATNYSYIVEACGSVTGVRQFRTAAGPNRAIHFTAMGDYGTGGSDQARVLALLNKSTRHGDFMLTLGDNAYSSGTDSEFQNYVFAPMAPLLRETPFFPSPGNHEYESNDAQPYIDNFYLPANNPERAEYYYSFDWGPVHFVALDSSCAIGYSGPCDDNRQLAWAEDDLAASNQPFKVVYFHHPPWSSGDHGSEIEMRRDYAPLFEEYGVDLVLTGHDHNYERSKPMKGDAVAKPGERGVVYVVVGTGGASLRSFDGSQPSWSAFRGLIYGYLSVRVDQNLLQAQLIDTNGIARDSFTIEPALKKTSSSLPMAARRFAPSALATPAVAQPDAEPPGPREQPGVEPAFLTAPKPAPADTPEAVADKPTPSR
jgi:hypothetical protein